MEQNEQDLQRFLQIREEIHHEIAKLQSSVISLQEASKRFVAHFDVFKKISQTAQEHMKSAIKGASHEMAEIAAEEFSERVEKDVQDTIRCLDRSVQNARSILDHAARTKSKNLMIMAFFGCLLATLMGFGLGYLYSKKSTYSLSKEVLETYQLGLNLQKAWPKLNSKEKGMIEKRMFKK